MSVEDRSQNTKTQQKKAQVLINFHSQNPYKQICGPRGTTPSGVLSEMKIYQGPLAVVETAPNAPTNITGVAGNTQVIVSWTPPTIDGGSSITGYIITSSPGTIQATVSGNVTTGIVTGLTNGTSYTFTVAALNSVNTGPSSTASASVTPATVPNAPTNITGVAGNTQVTVSWTPPIIDGGSSITGYIITSAPGTIQATVSGNVTTGIVTGLTNGTSYTFTVAAVNSVNTGPSSTASASIAPVSTTTPTVTTTSYVQTVNYQPSSVKFTGLITSNGGATITSMGAVYSVSNSTPTLSDIVREYTPLKQSGSFELDGPASGTQGQNTYARAYATNSEGTSYGSVLNLNISICLAKGTLITLLNGEKKAIENIDYADRIVVWDFDLGVFSEAKALWIKKAETANQYNLLNFSDGTSLKTINQHRIFNKEKGMFTYPMTDATPVGSTTFNDSGAEVTLISKTIMVEEVIYYNVITNIHINLFANGILTSCRYNNIYPITHMKFVKENRPIVPKSKYPASIGAYYEGLRLAEQTLPIEETLIYVDRLERLKL